MQSVLIFGAGGFFGRALTSSALDRGWEISWVTRQYCEGPPGVRIHSDFWELSEAAQTRIIDGHSMIVYAASRTKPSTPGNDLLRECNENLIPLAQLMRILQGPRGRAQQLIYLSSAGSLYDDYDGTPASETDVVSPASVHGAGKAASEALLRGFFISSGLSVSVLRPSNLYGPSQALRPGFGLVAHLFESLINSHELILYRNGQDRRDFLYIDDLVDVIFCLDATSGYRLYNVGSGVTHSVQEVVSLAEKVTKKRLRTRLIEEELSPAKSISVNTDLIKRELGWQPKVSLEQGLEKVWQRVEADANRLEKKAGFLG